MTIYDVWFLRYRVQQAEFFVILIHFLPFYSHTDPENQNFEKMKKTPGDITILQMSTINDSHMMYGSWLRYGVQQTEFFVILDCFLPFYHPNKPKNQNFEIIIIKKNP